MILSSIFRPLVLLVGLLALAACTAPNSGGGFGGDIGAGPVRVALLVPLGSDDPQREELAQSLVNAARLAEGDLQGVDIAMTVYPTAGDPGQATAAINQALADGASVVLGPLFSPSATAVAPVAAGRGVPVLSFSNNTQIAGGNLFLLGYTFENTSDRLVGYASAQGLRDIGIVQPEGLEGDLASAAIGASAATFGSQVVARGSYELSVAGITQAVPDISRNLRAAGANVVFLTDGPTGGLTFVAETLRGTGLRRDAVRLAGLQRWDTSPQALAQPGLDGGWFAAPDPVLSQQFANRYEARYGSSAHPLAPLAFDGVAAIGALVKEARAEGRSDAFSTARLTQPQGFAGVGGIFRFRPDGRNERGLAVFEVVEGAATEVDPAPRSFDPRGS